MQFDPAALLFGPQYLRSPALRSRLDESEEETYIIPMRGREVLYCAARDILDLLAEIHTPEEEMHRAQAGALALLQESLPGMDFPTPEWLTTREYQEAITRLARMAPPAVRNPSARVVLQDMAKARGKQPQDFLRDFIFPASVLRVLDGAYTPRRIQLGRRERLKDAAGLWSPMVPTQALALDKFVQWFRQQLHAASEAILTDSDYPPYRSESIETHAETVDVTGNAWEVSLALSTPSPEDMYAVEATLAALRAAASPRQLQIMDLMLALESSPDAVATALQISRSSVHTHLNRLRGTYQQL